MIFRRTVGREKLARGTLGEIVGVESLLRLDRGGWGLGERG